MAERPPARIESAKRSLVKRLAGEEGFVGAGVSTDSSGQYEIVVLVMEQTSPVLAKVPAEWEGFRVRAQAGGVPRKF